MVNPSIVSVLSAQRCETEKLQIRRSEFWRHRKMAVVFETLFELAKPNGYPNFQGRRFSMGDILSQNEKMISVDSFSLVLLKENVDWRVTLATCDNCYNICL